MCNPTGTPLVSPPPGLRRPSLQDLCNLLPNPTMLLPTPKRTAGARARTPVHITHVFTAIVRGDVVTLRQLLESGRVNDVNELYNGNTAGHHAAYHGNQAMLQLLASHGADFSVENKWGETAEHSARSGGQEATAAFLARATSATCSEEVQTAAAWVVGHLDGAGTGTGAGKAVGAALAAKKQALKRTLEAALSARYETHWHTENPQRGTGYRCLTSSKGNCDRIIEGAVHAALGAAGTPHVQAALRALPAEFSVWCDPGRVAVRVGGFHEDVQTIFGTPWAARSSTPPSPTLLPPPAPLSPQASTFAPAMPAPSLPASVWAAAADEDEEGSDGGDGWPPSPTPAATSNDAGIALQLQQEQEQLAALHHHHHHLMAQQAQMQHAAYHHHHHHQQQQQQHADHIAQHMQFVAQGGQHPRHHSSNTRHHQAARKPESRNLAAFVMDALERKTVTA